MADTPAAPVQSKKLIVTVQVVVGGVPERRVEATVHVAPEWEKYIDPVDARDMAIQELVTSCMREALGI